MKKRYVIHHPTAGHLFAVYAEECRRFSGPVEAPLKGYSIWRGDAEQVANIYAGIYIPKSEQPWTLGDFHNADLVAQLDPDNRDCVCVGRAENSVGLESGWLFLVGGVPVAAVADGLRVAASGFCEWTRPQEEQGTPISLELAAEIDKENEALQR